MPSVNQSNDSGLHVKAPRVAGFTLLELIHEGSCGVIYRARQDRLGRVVALKLLPEWPPPTDIALERFNRSAYVSAQAPNPNLVTLYDTGTTDGYHFISLEYLNGQTLQKHLSVAGVVDEPFAVNVAVQVLRALSALHSRDICHRNVKPKNIFLETNGTVRLIGLGLASCRTAFFSPHLDAKPIGTPHFMAPEMIRGSYSDPRSDLYSLGITLYVIVTGQTPFEKGSQHVVMLRHLTDDAVPLPEVRPGLSREFVTFVHTLMTREAERRFQTARSALEAAEGLAKTTAGMAPAAPEVFVQAGEAPAAPAPRVFLPPARRRWWTRPVPVAGLAAVVTVAMLLGLWQIVAMLGKSGQSVPAAVEPGNVPGRAFGGQADAAQGDSAEKAEFSRLVETDFRVNPVAGAQAWDGYLARFPNAPAAKQTIARGRRELYLNLDEVRRKPKAESRPEQLDF